MVARAIRWTLTSFALCVIICDPSSGQSARLNGFVTDADDGRPIELANVSLLQNGSVVRGTTTDVDGIYHIENLTPGRYHVRVSFVGYAPYTSEVFLAPGDARTLNVRLIPRTAQLDEVLVRGARPRGMANATAGRQEIRPEEVDSFPHLTFPAIYSAT